MFPKNPSGDQYPDLYEEMAEKKYDIASVFGTAAPSHGSQAPTFRKPRSDNKPSFVTVVKKKRHFVRPGEEPKLREAGEPLTADNLFRPSREKRETEATAETSFRPKL